MGFWGVGIDRIERVEIFSRVEHKEHKDFEEAFTFHEK